MGKWIHIRDIDHLNPFWASTGKTPEIDPQNYFPRIESSRDRNGYGYHRDWLKTIKTSYPHVVAINLTEIDDDKMEHNIRRIEIRKLIERELSGDVISVRQRLDYRYLFNSVKESGRQARLFDDYWEVYHGFWTFHFETEAEAVLFKLRFVDIVSEFSLRKAPYDNEEDIHPHDQLRRPREDDEDDED